MGPEIIKIIIVPIATGPLNKNAKIRKKVINIVLATNKESLNF